MDEKKSVNIYLIVFIIMLGLVLGAVGVTAIIVFGNKPDTKNEIKENTVVENVVEDNKAEANVENKTEDLTNTIENEVN